MIVTATLNPSVDRTLIVDAFRQGDVNRVLRTETDAGGKGINLARVAKEMGADALALGLVAGGTGAYVRSVLDRECVPHDFIEVSGETRMNVTVQLDDASAPSSSFNERGPEVPGEAWNELVEKCRARGVKARWGCVGGSIPPGLKSDALLVLAKVLKSDGCRLALDADGDALRFGLQATPDLVKPNAREAEKLFQMPVRTKAQCLDAAKKLYDMGVAIAVVSRGAAGAVMVCGDGTFDGLSPIVETKSTIGSGDSMVGAMLWAIEEGKELVEAFAWGLAAGAATAATNGAEICRRPVVEKLLSQVRIEHQPLG